MVNETFSLLDELRQIPQRTVLHNQVNVLCRLMAVDQGDDVRVLKALEDVDFGGKVILQLLIELR